MMVQLLKIPSGYGPAHSRVREHIHCDRPIRSSHTGLFEDGPNKNKRRTIFMIPKLSDRGRKAVPAEILAGTLLPYSKFLNQAAILGNILFLQIL